MRRRRDFTVCGRAAWAIALLGSAVTQAVGLLPADDGWYAWTVDARGDHQRCCFEWDGGEGRSTVCRLDGRSGGFGTDGHSINPTGNAVVYVRQVSGRIEKANALSASCKVSTTTPIKHIDTMSAAQSVALLGGILDQEDDLADDVLSALAAHAADEARALILTTAKDDGDENVRAKAWFWLAQTQWARTEETVMAALVTDPSHFARQGAVFALSQLSGERAVDALIRVVETGTLDQRDRRQALFWLAQADDPRSLDYLSQILKE